MPDGAGFEWNLPGAFLIGGSGDPVMAFEFRRTDTGSVATVLYRHPFSRGRPLDFMRKAAVSCFEADYNKWAVAKGEKVTKSAR